MLMYIPTNNSSSVCTGEYQTFLYPKVGVSVRHVHRKHEGSDIFPVLEEAVSSTALRK